MGALKVVTSNDKPGPERTAKAEAGAEQGTVKAAAAKSQRDLLVALRDNIAGQIDDGVPARDLASLSRRLLEITKEIAALDALAAEEGDGSDGTPDEEYDPSAI